jgi:signal peptidase
VLILSIALGTAAGLALGATVPRLLGYNVLVALSGSMEPTIATGDLVVGARIRPLDAKVGDIVTFQDPDRQARLITHRVRRMRVSGDRIRFETKGDANNNAETWTIARDGTVGRVEYRIPKLGYVWFWAGGRLGRLLLIVAPALLLGTLELRRIWRRKPEGRDR